MFSVKFTCAQPFLILANVFYIQIMASGNLPPQRREVVVRGDGNCFYGAIAHWNDEVSDEKHEEIRRLSYSLTERNPKVFEPLLFSSNCVEDHVKNSKIMGTWAETVGIFSCASPLERPICTFSSSQKKWYNFEPIMKTDSFSSLTKKKCKCPITLMYHDEYAQANHFNLLLPRGSCCSVPLSENTASSVSIDLENSGNSYAKAVKQTSQTHPSFKPHLIKAIESKRLGQDLTSLNTKTLPLYSKTTAKRPNQSPEATTTKQTAPVKQLIQLHVLNLLP